MAARWQFRGPGGWQDFHQEQHEWIHAAWLGGRSEYSFSLMGNEYRIDLASLLQVNLDSGTQRSVRPPAWAAAEMKVSAQRPARACAKAAASLLRGSEEAEPVCEVRLVALGAAMANAVQAAALVEVRTELVRPGSGQREAPQLTVRLRSLEAVARMRRGRWDRLTGAVGQEAEQMPKLHLLRLMKEFRRVDQAVRAAGGQGGAAAGGAAEAGAAVAGADAVGAPGGVVRCEPVEDSLLEWDIAMAFPMGSAIRQGLEDFAGGEGAEDPDFGRLLLRARFPCDFPANPPEVWVRRPRLVHRTASVTFGGRLCCPLLSSAGWLPATPMTAVFEEVQRALMEPGTEVDGTVLVTRSYLPHLPSLERLRTNLIATANSFVKKGIKVMSPETAKPFLGDIERLELSDKIALPLQYLEEICQTRSLETPAMFEVKTSLGRKRHCAVFDWVDGIPGEHAILPRWVMDDLCVEEWEQVQVRGVKLDLVSYVKVQPHSADFYGAAGAVGMEVRELLTQSLSSLSGLTEDSLVPIRIGDQTFNMQVVELRPQGAVRIIDSDVEEHFEFQVDFEPAPDLHDEAAAKARHEKLLADYKAQQEQRESLLRSRAERREATKRRRYEAALAQARKAAGEHDGSEGAVEVPVRLPDGSQAKGLFREGAPIEAIAALALASAWAQASSPYGVRLQERHPPRALQEGMTIGKAMHRSVIVVREEVLEVEEDDAASAEGEPGALNGGVAGDGPLATEAVPPPLPPLERNISQMQRRTLQAFEAQAFVRIGVDPEEAERRARNGEVAPPVALSTGHQPPKNKPGLARREAPRKPQLHRTVSQEERRDAQVEEVMNIVGITRAEAECVLQEHDWNTERAINALFDALADG